MHTIPYQQGKTKARAEEKNVELDDSQDAPDAPVDALELGVQAALSRQYEQDARAFLQSLAFLLESSLPGETVITRSGLFGGDKRPIKSVQIAFSPDGGATAMRYVLENANHHRPSASRVHVVRGVTVKNEPITVEEWINAVASAITQRSQQSKQTREALRSLLD